MCHICQIRLGFGDVPKPECVHKSASKLKSGSVQKEPYYITLQKFYGGIN